jgi:lantibiotic modifying enzyme
MIDDLPQLGPDLFNGTAGRARFHLWVADALGDEAARDAAHRAAQHLVRVAMAPAPGRVEWEQPDAVGGGRYLGYAHGSAGIADVLLDVADATGDDALIETALAAGRWITDHAVWLDGGAVGFPSQVGQRTWMPLWCHGAVGIGRFLLSLERRGLLTEGQRPLLRGCAIAAARLGRSLGPVPCHGLAGSIELLLDLHAAEPDGGHFAEAVSLAELVEQFHIEGDDGHLRCSSDGNGAGSPDLTVGYAGVATTWLRLAQPGTPAVLAGRSPA